MIIALFPNSTKKQSNEIARGIKDYLIRHDIKVVVSDEDCKALNADPLSSVNPESIDFRICLGGDGTILRVIHNFPDIKAPIMAVNLGSLGFMADIPADDVAIALEQLVTGNFKVDKRMIMSACTSDGNSCCAVNEITVHRGTNPCLIDLGVYVDDRYLNTFSADGLIVSTPSGSTAYSLAAGGPIVSQEVDAFVVTPICPHTLSNRPIVLKPNKMLRIINLSNGDPLNVDYDGFSHFKLKSNESISISISEQKFPLISFPGHDYFATLRTKLGWSGKIQAKLSH